MEGAGGVRGVRMLAHGPGAGPTAAALGVVSLKGSLKGALKGAAGGGAHGQRRTSSGGQAGASGATTAAASPPQVKSVRWSLPEGASEGSGEGLHRARVRAMKHVGKVDKSLFLPPGGATPFGTPGQSVLNKIFSAQGSACLEVKGKNSLGYIVNRAFMNKNRKMERQIERLLRENAKLKRVEPVDTSNSAEVACTADDDSLPACNPSAF